MDLMIMDLRMSKKLEAVMFLTLDLLVHTVNYGQVKDVSTLGHYMHIIDSFSFS